MQPISKNTLRDLHRPTWAGTALFVPYVAVFFTLQGLGIWCLTRGWHLPLIPIVLVLIFLMHALLLAFHEAAHGSLCPWKPANDFFGMLVGAFCFMSLTLYRTCHHWHHAWLADRRDEELWPFNQPTASRRFRLTAAFLELFCGLLYTPFLFLRSFLRPGSMITDPARRRRIWLELFFMTALWAGSLTMIAVQGWWWPFVIVYLIPAWLAGSVQSLRKYIEHVGLTGGTMLDSTRSVRPTSFFGRLLSHSIFNEPLHDIHHLYPTLPQSALPEAAAAETPVPPEVPVFDSYRAAFWDLLRSLPDPRIGKQWLDEPARGLQFDQDSSPNFAASAKLP